MPIGVPPASRLTWWHVRETFPPNISALRFARLATQRIAIVPCLPIHSLTQRTGGPAPRYPTGARLAIGESAATKRAGTLGPRHGSIVHSFPSNSLWQLMQDMYWLSFWANPVRAAT